MSTSVPKSNVTGAASTTILAIQGTWKIWFPRMGASPQTPWLRHAARDYALRQAQPLVKPICDFIKGGIMALRGLRLKARDFAPSPPNSVFPSLARDATSLAQGTPRLSGCAKSLAFRLNPRNVTMFVDNRSTPPTGATHPGNKAAQAHDVPPRNAASRNNEL